MASPYHRDDTWIWILVIVILLVPGVFMMGVWGTGMMGGYVGSTSWGIVGLVLLAVVVVLVIVLLARGIQRIPPPPAYSYYGPPAVPVGLTPTQILDARYARGEITRDEYLRIRQDLESRKP